MDRSHLRRVYKLAKANGFEGTSVDFRKAHTKEGRNLILRLKEEKFGI